MNEFCRAIEGRFDADFVGASLHTKQFEDQNPINRYHAVLRRPDGSYFIAAMDAHNPSKQDAIKEAAGENACFVIRHDMQPWAVDTSVVQTRDINQPQQHIEQLAPGTERIEQSKYQQNKNSN